MIKYTNSHYETKEWGRVGVLLYISLEVWRSTAGGHELGVSCRIRSGGRCRFSGSCSSPGQMSRSCFNICRERVSLFTVPAPVIGQWLFGVMTLITEGPANILVPTSTCNINPTWRDLYIVNLVQLALTILCLIIVAPLNQIWIIDW